jgi:hypothetical protein
MYAMTYRNDSIVKQNFKQSNLYGLLQNVNGTTYEFPEPFNSSFGLHSPYLKINRISCNGCARIQQAKCTTSTKVAEGINSRPPITPRKVFQRYRVEDYVLMTYVGKLEEIDRSLTITVIVDDLEASN